MTLSDLELQAKEILQLYEYPKAAMLPLLWLVQENLAPFVHAQGGRTTVAVLGVMHGAHLESKRYSIATVIATVRKYKPEVVFVEIPPYLYETVLKRIDARGFDTRRKHLADLTWTKAFPELYRGVIPLRKELGYTVVPVSGWRPEVSADRRKYKRPADRNRIYEAVRDALAEIRRRENDRENPRFLNSQHYADLRHLERTVWAASFDQGLGRGGEAAINAAHWGFIAKALDRHRGKRVLIVYGAAHRYWFLRELRKRKDVELVDVRQFLP